MSELEQKTGYNESQLIQSGNKLLCQSWPNIFVDIESAEKALDSSIALNLARRLGLAKFVVSKWGAVSG
jgi:hypothetical protein